MKGLRTQKAKASKLRLLSSETFDLHIRTDIIVWTETELELKLLAELKTQLELKILPFFKNWNWTWTEIICPELNNSSNWNYFKNWNITDKIQGARNKI